jgi:molybdenum-dependent DNA-binding transcriptional regulator ModE
MQHQRRERHADHVVDQERRQPARQANRHGQQTLRRFDAAQRHADQQLEKARQSQHADDDHHAEQQEQRFEVDRVGLTA